MKRTTIRVLQYKGSGHHFAPFVVDGDRFWYRFASGPGATHWGYRFTVTPMRVRLDDTAALQVCCVQTHTQISN